MTTASWDRSRHIATAACIVALIGVAVGAVVLGVILPDAWWPHTGQAFAAGTGATHHDPCALIAGPAKTYCERGTTTTEAATDRHAVSSVAWRLVPACAGVAALMVWRLRPAVRQRRR
ncbi:hypothetical protein ACFWPQ_40960 [Streptomyces sp. NPDC058464]|uniref:hypothetical protein n=1 Tax=Streptomyces sp. NPDC058464 TaxID=3346511 RepID=UPI00364A336A